MKNGLHKQEMQMMTYQQTRDNTGDFILILNGEIVGRVNSYEVAVRITQAYNRE